MGQFSLEEEARLLAAHEEYMYSGTTMYGHFFVLDHKERKAEEQGQEIVKFKCTICEKNCKGVNIENKCWHCRVRRKRDEEYDCTYEQKGMAGAEGESIRREEAQKKLDEEEEKEEEKEEEEEEEKEKEEEEKEEEKIPVVEEVVVVEKNVSGKIFLM